MPEKHTRGLKCYNRRMVVSEAEFRCVTCKVANCAKKRLPWDYTVYHPSPNGHDIQDNPVQVVNCIIAPTGLETSDGQVFNCGSRKPMNAA